MAKGVTDDSRQFLQQISSPNHFQQSTNRCSVKAKPVGLPHAYKTGARDGVPYDDAGSNIRMLFDRVNLHLF